MAEQDTYVKANQPYERDTRYIETRITRDGADGYPVEAGRYRRFYVCCQAARGVAVDVAGVVVAAALCSQVL